MAFWGMELSPGESGTPLEITRRLVVKQLCLCVAGGATKPPAPPSKRPAKPSVLSVSVGDATQQYVVCRLTEGALEHFGLELPFCPGDRARLHLSGAHPVYLTGFLELEEDDEYKEIGE